MTVRKKKDQAPVNSDDKKIIAQLRLTVAQLGVENLKLKIGLLDYQARDQEAAIPGLKMELSNLIESEAGGPQI